MKNMTLAHIAEVCGGTYFGPEEKKTEEVADIVTDSRKAGEGSLFVAIPGERVDGHKFIPNVASQGALAVISEQKLETPPCPYILVKDSMEAIKAMAEYYMQQLNIPVVGITGSVGKTSTKETIASVLAQKYRVLKRMRTSTMSWACRSLFSVCVRKMRWRFSRWESTISARCTVWRRSHARRPQSLRISAGAIWKI